MRRLLALALAVAVGVTAVAIGTLRDEGKPSVTRESLARAGLRIGPPDPEQPVVVGRERAERVAQRAMASPVLGSVQGTCHETDDDVGYPCWVLAHDPAGHAVGGHFGAPPVAAAYLVSIVDSRTGEWVRGEMGGPGESRRPRDRTWARETVEQVLTRWTGSPAGCLDGVRPDFRGRPAFGCTVGSLKRACYSVIGGNLFRMRCADARTDSGRLVYRG
jgi:hypothetical protein